MDSNSTPSRATDSPAAPLPLSVEQLREAAHEPPLQPGFCYGFMLAALRYRWGRVLWCVVFLGVPVQLLRAFVEVAKARRAEGHPAGLFIRTPPEFDWMINLGVLGTEIISVLLAGIFLLKAIRRSDSPKATRREPVLRRLLRVLSVILTLYVTLIAMTWPWSLAFLIPESVPDWGRLAVGLGVALLSTFFFVAFLFSVSLVATHTLNPFAAMWRSFLLSRGSRRAVFRVVAFFVFVLLVVTGLFDLKLASSDASAFVRIAIACSLRIPLYLAIPCLFVLLERRATGLARDRVIRLFE